MLSTDKQRCLLSDVVAQIATFDASIGIINMQFSVIFDQFRTQKHNLTVTESLLASYIAQSGWAKRETVDGREYIWLSRNKIIQDMPSLPSKPDTIYRLFRKLHDKGLIIYLKHDGRDLVHVLAPLHCWGRHEGPCAPDDDDSGTEGGSGVPQEEYPGYSEEVSQECDQSPVGAGAVYTPPEPPPNSDGLSSGGLNSAISVNYLNNYQDINNINTYTQNKFERVYGLYPKKTNREAARKKWIAACKHKTPPQIDAMADGIVDYLASNGKKFQKCLLENNARYIPDLKTVIGNKVWRDETENVPAVVDFSIYQGFSVDDVADLQAYEQWQTQQRGQGNGQLERTRFDSASAQNFRTVAY